MHGCRAGYRDRSIAFGQGRRLRGWSWRRRHSADSISDGTQRDWDDGRIAILQHGFDIGCNFALIPQVLSSAKRRAKGLKPEWSVSIGQ
jgi:hypothetical protein